MSYMDSANLIDLSLEDETSCCTVSNKTECDPLPSKAITVPFLLSHTNGRRTSLDNNPFDSAQDMVNRQDDPFDTVEKEASLKAQLASNPKTEVKVANLLSLSDDNILDDKPIEAASITLDVREEITENILNIESPPVSIKGKHKQDSESDSNPHSSAENSGSAKLRTSMEYRKRLLKLSLSNATFNSPVTHRNTAELEDNYGTPVSTVLSRAAEFGEHLLSTESPLKLVGDDTAEEPLSLIESEKTFEADLEMLTIPILNDLNSPAVEPLTDERNSPKLAASKDPILENTLPSLEAIKAKLKAKKEETNNNIQEEIVSLIKNLKHLISKDIVDESKKQQANALLESLSCALKPSKGSLHVPQEPQPVKRQGTFDIELQKNEQLQTENQPLEQEIPTCMISSSGTYDGETTEDKQNLVLPEIAPLSILNEPCYDDSLHNNDKNFQNHLQTDVNNIVEQLSRLLITNSSSDNTEKTQNPTLIFVMNTNSSNQSINSTQNSLDAKQRSAFVASYIENSINDGSPDLTKVNPIPRRRTQSLSIYDKIKIVQLPLQQNNPRSIQNDSNIQLDDLPTVTNTPPIASTEESEFKTPARMVRRNSYSCSTPYTAQVGGRRTSFV